MATARGIYVLNADGSALANSGSAVELFDGGPIAYANFFNSGGIQNQEIGREYFVQVECLDQLSNGCVPARFTADVGTPAIGDARNNLVKGYPELILAGTKFGVPWESRASGQNQYTVSPTGIQHTNQTNTVNVSCYPAYTSDLPTITNFEIDIDEFGLQGQPERDILIESWFHDTRNEQAAGDPIFGTLSNVIGPIDEAGPIIESVPFERRQYNNVLLEQMVHIAPVGAFNAFHTDAAGGSQTPARHYCSTVTIGGWQWEIWYGRTYHAPLIVYNRIGPAGCTGTACQTDMTAEGLIDVPYQQLLEYSIDPNGLEARLTACGAANNVDGFWADPDHPFFPFNIMRENQRAAVSGIEIGLEPYYNGANDEPYGFVLNRVNLEVDNKELGTCIASTIQDGDLCALPVQFTGGGIAVCSLPVIFTPWCALPVEFIGKTFEPSPVDCINCPSIEPAPRLVYQYGSGINSITPEQFVDLVGATYEVTDVRVSSLPGNVVAVTNGAEYTPPSTGSDVRCGSIKMSYRYRCNETDDWINCAMNIAVCVTPGGTRLPDETITVPTGDQVFIVASAEIQGDDIVQPLVGPPVGTLTWTGLGWVFNYPPGLVGRFNIVVPSYANGDKGRDNQRCVTICLTGGLPRDLSEEACKSVLAVRGKDGRYRPVAKVSDAQLSFEEYGVQTFDDFESGELCISEPDAVRYTMSLTGCQQCGETPIQTGCDIDFMLIKDIRYVNPPAFYGTARINSKAVGLAAGEKTYSVALTGHGQFWATGWAL